MKTFATILIALCTLNGGAAFAADAFIQQASGHRAAQSAQVRQAANSRPVAVQTWDVVAAPGDGLGHGSGRKAGSVLVQQTGTDNRAEISQEGESHLAMILQTGSLNVFAGQQSGAGHTLRAEQSGTGNEIQIAQFGQGQSATAIQNGSGNQIHIVQR